VCLRNWPITRQPIPLRCRSVLCLLEMQGRLAVPTSTVGEVKALNINGQEAYRFSHRYLR
jgi:hypothetical protein